MSVQGEQSPDDLPAPRRRVYWFRMLLGWFIPVAVLLIAYVGSLDPITSSGGLLVVALFFGTPAVIALAICLVVHPVLVALDHVGLRHYLLGYVLAIHPLFLFGAMFHGTMIGLGFAFSVAVGLLPLPFIFWWLYYKALRGLRF